MVGSPSIADAADFAKVFRVTVVNILTESQSSVLPQTPIDLCLMRPCNAIIAQASSRAGVQANSSFRADPGRHHRVA